MPEFPDQADAADAELDEQAYDEARFKAKRKRALRVLAVAGLVILIGLGIYAIWPWLLAPFIYEGPLVQMAGEHQVSLVWYMTRPVDDGLSVRVGSDEQTFAVESDGRRCRATITGLAAGQTDAYTITLGRRALVRAAFRTNKPAGEPFTFIVFGDSGRGGQEQYRLAARLTAVDPDFLLHTGDVVYGAGERRDYRARFFVPYEELLRRVNLWPCLGNHDLYEPSFGEPYREVFELPENGPPDQPAEHNYWFDYASARIAVVDSNVGEEALRDSVAPWLADTLTETGAAWKFVVLHHPPYTGGHYEPDQRIQRTLVPVFERTGVDIVFSGHDHMYQRMHAMRAGEVVADGRGVVYIISGAGGARLYDALPPDERPAYVAALNNEVHSFTSVSVGSDQELTLEQIDLNGKVLDDWTLDKTARPGQQP
jgi:hypothetical protein